MPDRDEMIDAYRELVREQALWVERSMRALSADFEKATRALSAEIRAEVRALREESRRYHDRQDKRVDDLIDESRAQRRALLAILDRLDNGGAAPAA